VLPVTDDTIRLFLHVLGATVWVGGQIALLVIIPVLRPKGRETIREVAARFQAAAWVAYLLLVVTGIWNLLVLHLGSQSGAWLVTLMVKLTFVAITGLAAGIHVLFAAPRVRRAETDAERRRWAAMSGSLEAVSSLFALASLFVGVMLKG